MAAFAGGVDPLHDSTAPVLKAIDEKDKDALLTAGDGVVNGKLAVAVASCRF